jgi:hypothetical protein
VINHTTIIERKARQGGREGGREGSRIFTFMKKIRERKKHRLKKPSIYDVWQQSLH